MQYGDGQMPADPGPPVGDPLSVAVSLRDKDALRLVEEALDEGRVALAFQPIVQSTRTDRPAFYEGLIRVAEKNGRIVPAGDFIDVVEGQELGRRLDCEALRLGTQALSDVPGLRLSINMSARSIGYRPWARILHRSIRRDESIAERLILEITERSAIVMPEVVQSFMREFQEFGVCFALDDFGSGFSSFRYLRDFYFDIIKIDGQFIRGIHASPDDQVMVRALISLARHFDMLTVAEFVETEQDARILTETGVDCMQGHYFGRPTLNPHWDAPVSRQAG